MTDRYVLGHDVGTSGNKTVLCDLSGAIVASAYEAYPLRRPKSNWVEQDPDALISALARGSRSVLELADVPPGEVLGIGVSGQMFNVLAVDGRGNALTPLLSWLDMRSVKQANEISARLDFDAQFDRFGNVFTAKDIVPKVLWIRDAAPDIWRRSAAFLDCKDYVNARLTGKRATDHAGASATFLFDIERRRWAEDRATELGIPVDRLPEALDATTSLGGLATQVASEAGLLPGTPVVVAAGDVPAGQIAAGASRPGEAHLSLGTACYLGLTLDRPRTDPGRRLGVLCHVDPTRWLLWAEMETGGGAVAWLRDLLGGAIGSRPMSGTDVDRLAASVSPDKLDLLFAPWLTGERVPLWDHDARGAFVGLRLHHGAGHLARAVIEGIAFQLRWAVEYAEDFGLDISEIRVIGGAGMGLVLPRVLADVLSRPLALVVEPQSAGARGAALCAIAGIADGEIDRLAESTGVAERIEPEDRHRPAYERRFEAFKSLHAALEGPMRSLIGDQ